jgi:hypothetical protein
MKGDTIVTTFVQARDTVPGDTARPRREVESVLAVGGSAAARAASVYRVKDEKDPSLLPAINYLLARRILAIMANGEVASVQAAGEVQAVYLQPDGQPAAAAPGRVGAAPPVRRQ